MPAQFHVTESVNTEQVDATVPSDRLCLLALVGGLDQLVDQLRSQCVTDAEPLLGRGSASGRYAVGPFRYQGPDQTERFTRGDPGPVRGKPGRPRRMVAYAASARSMVSLVPLVSFLLSRQLIVVSPSPRPALTKWPRRRKSARRTAFLHPDSSHPPSLSYWPVPRWHWSACPDHRRSTTRRARKPLVIVAAARIRRATLAPTAPKAVRHPSLSGDGTVTGPLDTNPLSPPLDHSVRRDPYSILAELWCAAPPP